MWQFLFVCSICKILISSQIHTCRETWLYLQRTMNIFILLNMLSVSICWFCFKYPLFWYTSKTQFSQIYDDKDDVCYIENISKCFMLKKTKLSLEEDLNKPVNLLLLSSSLQCESPQDLSHAISDSITLVLICLQNEFHIFITALKITTIILIFLKLIKFALFALNPSLQCESSPEMSHAITFVLIFIRMIKFVCHDFYIFISPLKFTTIIVITVRWSRNWTGLR